MSKSESEKQQDTSEVLPHANCHKLFVTQIDGSLDVQ